MKITAVGGFPVKAGHRHQFIVTIDTDDGISGVGEGGISGRELAMQGMLQHFAGFLIGEDPRRIKHLWQTMYRGAYIEGGACWQRVQCFASAGVRNGPSCVERARELAEAKRRFLRSNPGMDDAAWNLMREPRPTIPSRCGKRRVGGEMRAIRDGDLGM
jgi:hypothetical protein